MIKTHRTRRWWAAALLSTALQGAATAQTVPAPGTRDLSDALVALALKSGRNIVFSPELVSNKRCPVDTDTLPFEAALQRMLSENGLTYRVDANGTVTVRPRTAVSDRVTGLEGVRLAQADAGVAAVAGAVPAPEPTELDAVVVTGYAVRYDQRKSTLGTKTDAAMRDIPQSVVVLGEKLLAEQQPTTIEEVVRNVAGLGTVSRFGGRQDHLALRGFEFGVNRNGLLRNGVQSVSRVQSETGNLDRVEVLKGPSSILYGRLEVGGIVNTITRKPEDAFSGTAGLEVGRDDRRRVFGDVTGPLTDELSARLYASDLSTDSFRDEVFVDRQVVNPSISWRPDRRLELLYEAELVRDKRLMDRGIVAYLPSGAQNTAEGEGRIVKLPANRFLGDAAFDRSKFRTDAHWLTVNWAGDNYTVTSVTGLSDAYELRVNSEPSALTTPASLASGRMTRSIVDGETRQKLRINDTYINFKQPLFGLENQFLAGFSVRRETESESRVSRFQAPVNIYTGEVLAMPTGQTRYALNQQTSNYRSETDVKSLYFSNRLRVAPQWQLFIGGRYEDIEQRIAEPELRNAAGAVVAGARAKNYDFSPFAPSVGLIYQPLPSLSLYANYTESFSQQNDAFLAGTATDLEAGRQVEFGLKGEFLDGRVTTGAAVFEIEKSDMTIVDGTLPNGQPNLVSIGKARSRGIELDMNLQLDRRWSLLTTYAYLDTETVLGGGTPGQGAGTGAGGSVTGRPLPGAARHSASLWSSYRFGSNADGALTLAGGVFAQSKRAGNAAAQFFVPGYARVDLSAVLALRHSRLQLSIENALDREYILGARGTANIEPGAPRTWRLRFTQSF